MFPLGQGRRNLPKLLKTGQVTQYGGYLDDGYYQKGIAKSYTILTTGQYSGTCAIALNGKTDTHKNECVVDNNTGLMWSRYVSASVGPNSNGTLPWTTTTGTGSQIEGIFPYCAAASAANLGGYSDWRISNLFELRSLQVWQAPNALPNSTAFPSFPSAFFWTATTAPETTTSAVVLYSHHASEQTVAKTSTYVCLLVRGG